MASAEEIRDSEVAAAREKALECRRRATAAQQQAESRAASLAFKKRTSGDCSSDGHLHQHQHKKRPRTLALSSCGSTTGSSDHTQTPPPVLTTPVCGRGDDDGGGEHSDSSEEYLPLSSRISPVSTPRKSRKLPRCSPDTRTRATGKRGRVRTTRASRGSPRASDGGGSSSCVVSEEDRSAARGSGSIKSGCKGVSWNKRMQAWLSFWSERGTRKSKTFSAKGGFEEARQQAIDFLTQKRAELEKGACTHSSDKKGEGRNIKSRKQRNRNNTDTAVRADHDAAPEPLNTTSSAAADQTPPPPPPPPPGMADAPQPPPQPDAESVTTPTVPADAFPHPPLVAPSHPPTETARPPTCDVSASRKASLKEVLVKPQLKKGPVPARGSAVSMGVGMGVGVGVAPCVSLLPTTTVKTSQGGISFSRPSTIDTPTFPSYQQQRSASAAAGKNAKQPQKKGTTTPEPPIPDTLAKFHFYYRNPFHVAEYERHSDSEGEDSDSDDGDSSVSSGSDDDMPMRDAAAPTAEAGHGTNTHINERLGVSPSSVPLHVLGELSSQSSQPPSYMDAQGDSAEPLATDHTNQLLCSYPFDDVSVGGLAVHVDPLSAGSSADRTSDDYHDLVTDSIASFLRIKPDDEPKPAPATHPHPHPQPQAPSPKTPLPYHGHWYVVHPPVMMPWSPPVLQRCGSLMANSSTTAGAESDRDME
ncbi:unnamed protein product [Vitrella brassicaformis CCMP3155]|uniref:AP2/ERF domain-containing protein n=3 Tax=Vitrella brassicaformis TaxID=1169539 RepID=A0A0G4EW03_VITBC|nr:unnamed protein product [Vitrella brassicaformis CCMP3155]|eukprot:CEM02397.1 unnamed protein product [Vitrella brassicaformis CCMP3155]